MTREEALDEIDHLLQRCSECNMRVRLYQLHGSAYSRIDGYCNKVCPIGGQLQELGRELAGTLRERRFVEEDWEGEALALAEA